MHIVQRDRPLSFLAGLMAAAMLLCSGAALAQNFPSRPITVVVPTPPGGTSDFVTRVVAEALSKKLGQAVVVDNKPGAGSNIGTAIVARAKADGYTLLSANTTIAIASALYKDPGFDPAEDFSTVGVIGTVPNVLLVNPSFPANTLDEFIELIKSHPNKFDFASAGSGSPNHLLGVMLDEYAGLKLHHIPYKGVAPAMTDVLGNQVPIVFASLPSALPYIQSGQLRALGVSSANRSPALPDVPAIGEKIPNYSGDLWLALFGQKSIPQDVRDELISGIADAVANPQVKDALAQRGIEPLALTAKEFDAFAEAEYQKWGGMVTRAGAQVD
ncbi:MAG: tripartite tricarboxylate transporter substrate binding protein [Pusillimonas sp.]